MKYTINNKFFLEPYKSDGVIRATNSSGFALISQKVSLKGLKVLVDVVLAETNGSAAIIPAGSIAYVREELLHTQPWAKQIMESEDVDGRFIIVDKQHVEMIDEAEDSI
jgi:hypothetical protein